MRTVYLGTSAFGAAVLERLARSAHRPDLVVTRPDRPRGRGRRTAPPPVAETAAGLGIAVYQPEAVNSDDARARIATARPDAVVICAFGALLKEPLLSAHETLNVHPSLLPRWRGAAPIERAIEAGDAETGVSIMRPVAEMDAGPVCLVHAEPVHPDDDFGSLSARLERLGGDLLVEALDTRPAFRGQPTEGVTIAEKVSGADRRLAGSATAAELERRVRALHPHVGAFVEPEGGERLGVLKARLAPAGRSVEGAPDEPAGESPPSPGELREAGGRLLFGCADGALELLVVKPAGGRAMDAGAYLRGRRRGGSAPRSGHPGGAGPPPPSAQSGG